MLYPPDSMHIQSQAIIYSPLKSLMRFELFSLNILKNISVKHLGLLCVHVLFTFYYMFGGRKLSTDSMSIKYIEIDYIFVVSFNILYFYIFVYFQIFGLYVFMFSF